jgi:hypothetical protein
VVTLFVGAVKDGVATLVREIALADDNVKSDVRLS